MGRACGPEIKSPTVLVGSLEGSAAAAVRRRVSPDRPVPVTGAETPSAAATSRAFEPPVRAGMCRSATPVSLLPFAIPST